MRIAYFIMLHHKPEQFRWLFEAIRGPEDVFLLHVDRKAPDSFRAEIERTVRGMENVRFLRSQRVAWGGWSQVEVELAAIRELLALSADWSCYVNLSGQDYPIKPMAEIRETLRSCWPANHIGVTPFTEIRRSEPDDPHLAHRVCLDLFGRRCVRTPLRWPSRALAEAAYKGSSWHMLSRDFCAWAVSSETARRLASRLRFTISPDETFFQALLMNGPFAATRANGCGREVIWPGPKVLRFEDAERLGASANLFARKFDQEVDRDILVWLADRNGHPIPDEARARRGGVASPASGIDAPAPAR